MYNVQCIAGHVFAVHPDTKLGRRCREREKSGYVDALTVPAEECPDCQEAAERRNREYASAGVPLNF